MKTCQLPSNVVFLRFGCVHEVDDAKALTENVTKQKLFISEGRKEEF